MRRAPTRATNGSPALGAKRRRPEAGIDESAWHLRAVFEQAAVGIVCVGLDNRYLQVNRKFCEMVGYSAAELIGEPATKVSHPDEQNWARALRERLLRGEIPSFTQEKRYIRKDGAIIWVNCTESLVRDEAGCSLYYVRVIEDITRRKEIELDFEPIYEQAAVGITRVDLDGVLTGVNRKFCEMLGYAREELLGRHVREVTHPEDYEEGERFRGEAIRGERRSASSEKRFVRKDGSIMWARRTMSVARDLSGKPLYVISIVEDVTDRKRLEMQIEQTFEQAPVGIVRADFAHNILAVNARFCEMVGYSREELLQMNLQQISHPDDLAIDMESRAKLLSGEITSFASEKRYVRRDGSVIWVRRTVSLARDAAGAPEHLVFVVEDVTGRKDMEQRFRLVFDNAGSGIMMSDLAATCLMVNRRLADMLGYEIEELVGRPTSRITRPEDRATVTEQRRRLLDGEVSSITGERVYVCKDGTPIWVNRTITLARDAAGEPLYFITVADDITERKRTEEELRRRNALALLVEALAVAANQARDPEEAMFACLRRMCDYIGWPIGHGVIFPGGRGNAKAQVSRWSMDDPERWRAFQAASDPLPYVSGSGDFVDRVVSSREALWVEDLSQIDHFARAAAARECGLKSCFAFPVLTGERVVAFLEFYSDVRVPPDRALLGAVNTVGTQLARVIERREAEMALLESERFAKATIDALADHICVIDERGTIVAVNQAWRRFGAENGFDYGHPWEGMNYLEVCESATGPFRGQARQVADGIRGVLSGANEAYSTEYPCHSENEERWFAVKVRRFAGSGAGRLVISHENVTERTLSNRRRAMEQAVARVLTESTTVEECMPRLLRVICEALGWAYGAYWSFSESEQNLVRREFWSDFEPEFDEADRDYWLRLGAAGRGGLLRCAWLDRKPSWIPDIRRDSTFKRQASALRLGLRSAYAFHIAGETGSLGVMEFFGREVRQPDAMLLEITDSIGRQIGQFVQRKRAEQALRESEERYRNLFDLAPIPLLVIEDGSFRVLAVNQAAVEKYGYSRDEFLAMTVIDLQVPEDREQVDLYLRQRDPARPTQTQRRHLTKNGERIIVEVTARPFLVEGRRVRILLVNDVTDRVRAEEALRESEERFRATFEQAGVGMALRAVDPCNPRWLRVNQKLCDILGYSKEELLNLTSVDITPPEDRDQAIEYNELLLRGELTSYSREKRYVRKDGQIIWANIFLSAVKGSDGRPSYVISVIQDVTDRKRAETALRESEEQFRQLASNIPEVFWICDAEQRCMIYVSPAFERITGRPVGLLRGNAARWLEVVHEDDRERVRAARKDAAKGTYDEVFRVVRPEGSIRWVRDRAFPVHGPDGKVYRITGIAEDITDRREAEEQLLFLAHYDNLTSLPNRVLFYDRLKQALSQARRNHWITAVMFLDLDRFKNINDTLGHGAGDLLLRQVSERLTACVRSGDTVGRLSGDEFAIVLSNLSGPDDASLVAQKIMSAFNSPFNLYGKEIFVTVSIGITIFPTDSTDQETLISNADTAMYRAKELGRNNFCFYTPEMNARALEKLALENSLRRALEREEFCLHFQPKVSLKSGEITGVEALLRWNHPELGVVAPSDFMPLLEETGIIVPVGVWAIRAACAQLKAWEHSGLTSVPVAVNLSARQFLDKELGAIIKRILEEFEVGPGLLELEITESSLAANVEEAAQTLNALNALGVRIAIDDFGTGHSSLSRLKRFPLDSLKIDVSFVRDVTTDADGAAITRAIITMGHSLGVAVVAEGVETEEQLTFLEVNGCDEIQGYYFSQPLSAEDCGKFIRSGWRLRRPREEA